MREILFRGKRIATGEWLEGYFLTTKSKAFIMKNGSGSPVHSNTVGQFTGLTDKNGKKIFEGDIIKAVFKPHFIGSYAIGKVVFSGGTFKISVYKSHNAKDYKEYTNDNISAYPIENNFINRNYVLEVIGNIHDNPELLGGAGE